jgi:hypothetical protein
VRGLIRASPGSWINKPSRCDLSDFFKAVLMDLLESRIYMHENHDEIDNENNIKHARKPYGLDTHKRSTF